MNDLHKVDGGIQRPAAHAAGSIRAGLSAPLLTALLFASGCATDFNSVPHPQPGEISVSSANYASTPAKQILASIDDTASVNPKLVQLKPLPQPKFYVFAPGEFDKSDISFDQVLRLLAPALAEKGYIEASSAARSGKNPDKKIDLVLRVHCGERTWRDPIIRTAELTWDDGLVTNDAMRTVDASGKSIAWDYRAGGDDAVLTQIEEAIGNAASSKGSSGFSGGGMRMPSMGRTVGPDDPNNPMSGLAQQLTAMPTRDFFLVVIEAFDFKDLAKNHGKAVRVWETFIALPKNGDEKFSQVVPAMMRVAGSYLGETTQGLAVFNDDRAKVEIGTPYEVPDQTLPQQPALPVETGSTH